jgi:hypothetical protein
MTEDEKIRTKLNCAKPESNCKKSDSYYGWSDKDQSLTEISFKSKVPQRK